MRTLGTSLLSVCLVGAFGCGGDDLTPRQFCEQMIAESCRQAYVCYTPAEREAEGLPATEAECVTLLTMFADCASVTEADTCDAGLKFQGDKAGSCLDEVEGVTCTQFKDPDFDPEASGSCAEVCS